MIEQIVVFFVLMRKERKILRFVPQKLRKSFANGNPMSKLEQIIKQKVKIMQWKLNRKTTKSILSGVLKDELKKYAGQNAVKI